jgi:hypothetical protein
VVSLITTFGLQTAAGNGKTIQPGVLEPLRLQLAALPHVNYGHFKKEDPTGADGLSRSHLFLDLPGEVTVRTTSIAHESYPDPSDEYLIRTFMEQYAASDVAGYGKRLRTLRRDFALCSLGKARELRKRLDGRHPGDRVSALFHDRLSTEGRAILLRVLRSRT